MVHFIHLCYDKRTTYTKNRFTKREETHLVYCWTGGKFDWKNSDRCPSLIPSRSNHNVISVKKNRKPNNLNLTPCNGRLSLGTQMDIISSVLQNTNKFHTKVNRAMEIQHKIVG